MFVDQLSASPHHRLNQILHTLKHVHACELPVHDAHKLQEWASQAQSDRAQIVEHHTFNSYMQQPAYVKANLILEAVRMLTEVAPKRRKTVKEHKEPHMRPLTEGKQKPDFLDLDKDGNRKEPMTQAAQQAKKKVSETKGKPDFLDLDKDGDRKEPMKQAAKQAKHKDIEEAKSDPDADRLRDEWMARKAPTYGNTRVAKGAKFHRPGSGHVGRTPSASADAPGVKPSSVRKIPVMAEKWDADMKTAAKDVGKWEGYTIAELKARKNKLMDKAERSAAEQKEVRQLNFAIRAKQEDSWGKVKEQERVLREFVETVPSDDAFDKIKKAGAQNVRTTSDAIVFSHKGAKHEVPHHDSPDGHRHVKLKDLNAKLKAMNAPLMEDANLDKAQTLLAAKDITDRLQGMAEDAAKMAVDDLMPLVDTMKDQFGLEQATAFNNVVKQQLQTVLDSIIAAKDQTDNAINTMETGGMPAAPADIGQPLPPMGGAAPAEPVMAPEGEPAAAEPGTEGEIDFEKEFAASPATSGPEEEPLGRAKKEVAEATLTPAQQKAQQALAKTAAEQMVKTRKKADGTMATSQELADAKKIMTEKLTKKMTSGEVISDFVHSDDPKFKGKSKAQRTQMALGAYYGMHPEKKLKESRQQVREFKQQMDQAVAAYQSHVGSLKESWIQQQGDLRSAVLQAKVIATREQLQEAIAEYKQHKQEHEQHVLMQEQVQSKIRKLDEQIARTPYGVKGELHTGTPFRKFFESAEMRDTWVRYNQSHIQQVQHVDVTDMQQVRDRLLKLI